MSRLKLLFFFAFPILLSLSCSKSDESFLFTFDSVIRMGLPAGLPPLLTRTYTDLESRHEANIDTLLAERGLSIADVRIEPRFALVDILNNSDWRFARNCEITFDNGTSRGLPIFISDPINRSTTDSWLLDAFITDLAPHTSGSSYPLNFAITPTVSNLKQLDIVITTSYSVTQITD